MPMTLPDNPPGPRRSDARLIHDKGARGGYKISYLRRMPALMICAMLDKERI